MRMSFGSYLPTYDLPNKVLNFLRKYPASHVFHYENYATKLYAPFVDLLSLPDYQEWNHPPFEIVNRSLSQSELQLMQLLNVLLPVKSSRFLGNIDFLSPESYSVQTYCKSNKKIVREFNARWKNVVDEINLLIPKQSMLKLPSID